MEAITAAGYKKILDGVWRRCVQVRAPSHIGHTNLLGLWRRGQVLVYAQHISKRVFQGNMLGMPW